MKRILPLLIAAFCMLLCGCASIRVRVAELPDSPYTTVPPALVETELHSQNAESPTPEVAPEPAPEPTEEPAADDASETAPVPESPAAEDAPPPPEPDTAAPEDPDASQKQFDSSASAETSPDAETPAEILNPDAEAPAAGAVGADGDSVIQVTEDEAERTVTETLSEDEAEKPAASDQAPAADTMLQYYQTLLASRTMELFECQKFNIYWETPTDYETVSRASAAHQIIMLAGGYDVSSKLQEDALTVEDGWVSRKNPGVIVKCVDSSVLGSGVLSDASARELRARLLTREDLSDTDAGRTGRVYLISSELLRSPAGQTAAAVYLAAAMYPDLMRDTDPQEALRSLMEESAGTAPSGLFAFTG